MIKLIIVLIGVVSCMTVSAQERWILVGDSIQSLVFEQDGSGQAKNLTANLIPTKVNVSIQNLSSPGARISNGYLPGAIDQKAAISYIKGYFGAKGVIITAGTNDWGNTPIETFKADYKSLVTYAVSQGLEVVCVPPLWRTDASEYKMANGDTTSYQLWVYRWVAQVACTDGGGKYLDSYANGIQSAEYFGDVASNKLHLNTAGHLKFTNWLVQQMQGLGFWV